MLVLLQPMRAAAWRCMCVAHLVCIPVVLCNQCVCTGLRQEESYVSNTARVCLPSLIHQIPGLIATRYMVPARVLTQRSCSSWRFEGAMHWIRSGSG